MKKLCLLLSLVLLAITFSACYPKYTESSSETTTSAEETTQSDYVDIDFTPRTNLKGSFQMTDKDGEVLITVEDIKTIEPIVMDGNGSTYYAISFVFTDEGTKKFAEVTANHIDEEINMIVDGEVLYSPVVNSQVTGGEAMLEGNFTVEEIKEIMDKIQG